MAVSSAGIQAPIESDRNGILNCENMVSSNDIPGVVVHRKEIGQIQRKRVSELFSLIEYYNLAVTFGQIYGTSTEKYPKRI